MLDEPVIVLTAARSGSTLLRLILDAHPDLGCPPETNIAKVATQLGGIFTMLDAEDTAAESAIRAVVSAAYRDYLRRRDKVRWCDKSLGTAQVAAWFTKLYPKAKFICLYRHCMDVIDSGLEASPWGLIGYGFDQAPGARNGNSVSALAAYWIEHTGRILEFEKQHGDRCLRVHYERLCQDPERTAGEIFSFIGVSQVVSIEELFFRNEDPGILGPGDHKVAATRKITADSVARGIRIPVDLIPPPQLTIVNRLLGELGYTLVDDAWRKSACPPALLPDRRVQEPLDPPASLDDAIARSMLDNIGEVIRDRIGAGFGLGLPRGDVAGSFGLVAYHPGEHHRPRSWRVDLAARSITPDSQPPADWLVTGDVATWLAVLAGRQNMASCIRSGALRYIDPRDQAEGLAEAVTAEKRLTVVRELLGLAGYPEEPAVLP